MNTLRFTVLTVFCLISILGCTRDYTDVITSPVDHHDPFEIEASFQMNILPILTERCALAGCHVADGPKGLDLRTYESFKAGSEHGPIFIPGNAEESEVVEQIKSGDMPPGGPPLTPDQIQLFVDWINNQPSQDSVVEHEHDDDMYDEHDENMDDEEDDHDNMHDEHGEDDDHGNE